MAKSMGIEDWFARVEEAIGALERGDLPLEEALRHYEAGLVGVRKARAALDRFATRLDELRTQEGAAADGDDAGA